MELRCTAQKYAWGVIGKSSSVAQIAQANYQSFTIEEQCPYAELWMGTHPNGPSVLIGSGESLSEYLKKYPTSLGSNIREKFGDQLSFLFKILSVNQALSIQAHPNKSHAEILHKDRPDVYKDPNHKPEMAIALTEFQALCGFRPAQQIVKYLKDLPELRKAVGNEFAAAFTSDPNECELKNMFGSLMNAQKSVLSSALDELAQRLKNNDCIECMACSDNVVRAGLTPKYQDVSTLVNMLEYSMSAPDSRKFSGKVVDEFLTTFNPPVPDFAVQMIKVPKGSGYTTSSEDSASILLVMEGGCVEASISVRPKKSNNGCEAPKTLKRGSILFLDALQTISFTTDHQFVAFRALCL